MRLFQKSKGFCQLCSAGVSQKTVHIEDRFTESADILNVVVQNAKKTACFVDCALHNIEKAFNSVCQKPITLSTAFSLAAHSFCL